MVRTGIGTGTMKGEASHLKVFRRAGLEPLALSASGRETMVYGLAAASEERTD